MIRADENLPEPTADEIEEMERADEDAAHWQQWEEDSAATDDIAETA